MGNLGRMAADFEKLITLMPFAGHLGITLVEASNERVVADLPWAPQPVHVGAG